DVHLNFPLKIDHLVRRCERVGARVVFYAAGVSDGWSGPGRRLFRRALASPAVLGLSVRDSLARDKLKALTGLEAPVTPDAGLWAADTYGVTAEPGEAVGLGVADPSELSSALSGWRLDPAVV